MSLEILEFTASGSPRAISLAIEEFATGQGSLNAIVVPWESDQVTLRMAVTSVKGEGWAIEHINLGTIQLTDLGNDTTRVAIAPQDTDHSEKKKMLLAFENFARNIMGRLQTAQ